MISVESFPKQLSQKDAQILMKYDTVANLMMLNTMVAIIFVIFTRHHFVLFWANLIPKIKKRSSNLMKICTVTNLMMLNTIVTIISPHFDTSSFCPVLGQFGSIIKSVWISMKLCKKITI